MLDLIVKKNEALNNQYSLLVLTSPDKLPEMLPGQFAIATTPGTNPSVSLG